MMNFINTEEAFVLATVKEFVKLWGSGSQAQLNLECQNQSAWVKLACQLGPPAAQHYVPHHDPRPPHSPRDQVIQPPRQKRHKGPNRREKDRARAAAHRDRIQQLNIPHGRSPPPLPAASSGQPSHTSAATAGTPPHPHAPPASLQVLVRLHSHRLQQQVLRYQMLHLVYLPSHQLLQQVLHPHHQPCQLVNLMTQQLQQLVLYPEHQLHHHSHHN